jgi:catechol 2,3-dioxygenase-like lactoylglutathione lyase family enzyme
MFYGMEQIGWDGASKPAPMFRDRVSEEFPVPQRAEAQEVEDSLRDGIDVFSGPRDPDVGESAYDVSGVLLQRPFRITRIGPIGLFARDVANMLAFYTRTMGFQVTEQVLMDGHECFFLRSGCEHHSLALYPSELKPVLGLEAQSTCAVLGFQVASYDQLKQAVIFLQERGVPVFELPLAFSTGIDYAAHFLDPDGHVIRLYHAMERVDWQGHPKPASLRNPTLPRGWPKILSDIEGAFAHEIFQGPLG